MLRQDLVAVTLAGCSFVAMSRNTSLPRGQVCIHTHISLECTTPTVYEWCCVCRAKHQNHSDRVLSRVPILTGSRKFTTHCRFAYQHSLLRITINSFLCLTMRCSPHSSLHGVPSGVGDVLLHRLRIRLLFHNSDDYVLQPSQVPQQLLVSRDRVGHMHDNDEVFGHAWLSQKVLQKEVDSRPFPPGHQDADRHVTPFVAECPLALALVQQGAHPRLRQPRIKTVTAGLLAN